MDSFSPKTCLKCGKALVGRADKKFCDAYCRNSYNNVHHSEVEQRIKIINSQIRKNRRILRTLCPEGKSTVRREVLEQMGYNFRYHTDLYKSQKGGIYYMCYDYGFCPIKEGPKEKALIIQRQNYMDEQQINLWR